MGPQFPLIAAPRRVWPEMGPQFSADCGAAPRLAWNGNSVLHWLRRGAAFGLKLSKVSIKRLPLLSKGLSFLRCYRMWILDIHLLSRLLRNQIIGSIDWFWWKRSKRLYAPGTEYDFNVETYWDRPTNVVEHPWSWSCEANQHFPSIPVGPIMVPMSPNIKYLFK
jgi:hypothetical protein